MGIRNCKASKECCVGVVNDNTNYSDTLDFSVCFVVLALLLRYKARFVMLDARISDPVVKI